MIRVREERVEPWHRHNAGFGLQCACYVCDRCSTPGPAVRGLAITTDKRGVLQVQMRELVRRTFARYWRIGIGKNAEAATCPPCMRIEAAEAMARGRA